MCESNWPHGPRAAAYNRVVALLKATWLWILVVGLVLFGATDLTIRLTGNVIYYPTVMVIGAFLVPVTFVTFFYRQEDLLERGVHGSNVLPTLLACALFGGLIGTLAAGLLEQATMTSTSPASVAWVGPIEELAKMIVPVVVFVVARKRFRSELDGLLFGVAAGMSFAALETMGYELVALVGSQGNLNVLDETILIRGLLSPLGPAAWTGLVAATLWRERERTGRPFSLAVLGFFLVAAALHSVWDLASSASTAVVFGSYAAIGAVSLALLIWRFRQARRTAMVAPHPTLPGSPA